MVNLLIGITEVGVFATIGSFICDLVSLKKRFPDAETWTTNDKLVNAEFVKLAKENGLLPQDSEMRWSNPEKVEERRMMGYEEAYFIDEKVKVRSKLVNKSKQVLVIKKLNT